MTDRVIWSDHPYSDAKATMRETPDGDVIVTTTAATMEGAAAAERFRDMLREHFGLSSAPADRPRS